MEIGDTLSLAALEAPAGVELVADEPEEITIVTLSPPRVSAEPTTGVEEEPAVVGEEESSSEAEAPAEDGGDSGEE
jgi:hypothetical protein